MADQTIELDISDEAPVPDFICSGKGYCRLEIVGAKVLGGRDRATVGDLIAALRAVGFVVRRPSETWVTAAKKYLRTGKSIAANVSKVKAKAAPVAPAPPIGKPVPEVVKAPKPKKRVGPKKYAVPPGSTRQYGPVAKIADVMKAWKLSREAVVAKIENVAAEQSLFGNATFDVDGVRVSKFGQGRYLFRFRLTAAK
jgi:hypothetical protein